MNDLIEEIVHLETKIQSVLNGTCKRIQVESCPDTMVRTIQSLGGVS